MIFWLIFWNKFDVTSFVYIIKLSFGKKITYVNTKNWLFIFKLASTDIFSLDKGHLKDKSYL